MGKNDKKTNKREKDKGARRAARTTEEQEAEESEVAKQVKEVEERLGGLSKEMNVIEGKIKHYLLEAKRAELTEKELQPLPEDSKIYRQVGKMFLLQPKPDLARSLKYQQALKSVETQQLRNAHNKIKEKVQSEANGLRELIGEKRMKQLFDGSGSGTPGIPGPAQKPQVEAMPLFGKAVKSEGANSSSQDKAPGDPSGVSEAV
mmetsp:Transcript_71007/g.114523  ORF Transcript_71007/g.114523 Transcript_71007/m.114523 type:complete len:204 (-) Transcript_71007:120-731(-)